MVSRETPPLRWMTDRGLCVVAGAGSLDLYRLLAGMRLPGVMEVVPADGSLLVVLEPGAAVPEKLLELLARGVPDGPPPAGAAPARLHRLPVRFDGEDLSEVAGRSGHTPEEVIGLLCSIELRVGFLGFQPGFAYLRGLPAELHLPRRASPRKHVPAGSLALAGGYCGIYPSAGPGGWHVLGSTRACLFDPEARPPARLQPGDSVRLDAA